MPLNAAVFVCAWGRRGSRWGTKNANSAPIWVPASGFGTRTHMFRHACKHAFTNNIDKRAALSQKVREQCLTSHTKSAVKVELRDNETKHRGLPW